MSRRKPLSTMQSISEINMTPLMDLTFILLITFIITFPLIEQGIPIDLPKGQAEEIAEDTSRAISLNKQGEIFLDELPIQMEGLRAEMIELGQADPNTLVSVRADHSLVYGKVMKVMQLLHAAGISRTALVLQAEGEPSS